MKYAFFDLDGTLIPIDSSILWAETLLNNVGPEKEKLIQERLRFDQDYRDGCLDIDKFEDFEMKLLARFPRKELDVLLRQYLREKIEPFILPKAVNLVNNYKKAGAKVIMVTASYRYPVEPIARSFRMDALLCAEPETDENGEFTGRCLRENFAASKVVGVKQYLLDRGESLDVLRESAFYSDSINDLPLLEFVSENGGKAVATNPDDALRKKAQASNWEILDLFVSAEKKATSPGE